jgi:CrcB protein
LDPDLDFPPTTRRRLRRVGPVRADIVGVITAGGVLGVAARYGVANALPTPADGFPWATFWINVAGSFVLGLFVVIVIERLGPTKYLLPFIGTGFLGSFTTFSTFSVEADLLIRDGHVITAAAYVAATLVVGPFAAWLGITVGRR